MPRNLCLLALWAGLVLAAPSAARAQDVLEAGMSYHRLGGTFGHWTGVYVQGVRQVGAFERWRLEAMFDQRYGDQGFLYKVQTTRSLADRWYGRAGASTSSGGFFHPRLGLDLTVARQFLPRRQLIALVGVSAYDAKDVHRDFALTVEAQYYAGASWVLQGSVRWNLSTPGDARSRYHFLALTQGRPQHHYVALRLGFGREAYTVIDPLTVFTDYRSVDLMVTWRQWIRPDAGFNLMVGAYRNPFFRRAGFRLGFFKQL